MIQKSKSKTWVDETGMTIPFSRINKVERLMERESASLLRDAKNINSKLTDYKKSMQAICKNVYEEFMTSKGGNVESKGNFTWFSFDRSIKVEVAVSERVTFDDLTIKVAQERLNQFLSETVDSKFDFVKDLVQEAFSTSRGKLDAKKVMSLLKYRERINHPLFHEAATLIEQSIRRPDQKTYFRIWEKDELGEYKVIELNFSNI